MNLSPRRVEGRSNSDALQSVETAYNVPWGLSDEKPPKTDVVVDIMSSLANNIQRFEIKRRLVRNVSQPKQRPRMRSNSERNPSLPMDSQYRLMVADCHRRIWHYQSCDKTTMPTVQPPKPPDLPVQKAVPNPQQRKSAELKSIEVKFGESKKQHMRSTSENLPLNIGEKFLNNIRARILSRRQSMRQRQEDPPSRPQSKQLRELADLSNRAPIEEQLGFLNVNKLMPHGMKPLQAKRMKIFDMEEFGATRKLESRQGCAAEFWDVPFELQPGKPLTGCKTERNPRQIIFPR